MKTYQKPKVLIAIGSILDNPNLITTINSFRKEVPEGKIFVWIDCCSDEHYSKVCEISDYVVRSNVNFGSTPFAGFSLLYLDFDYIIWSADDYILCEDYWKKMESIFNESRDIGIVGELCPLVESKLPDCPLVIKKSVIEDVGGICPGFGKYGYMNTEFLTRVMGVNKYHLIATTGAAKHIGLKDTINKLEKINGIGYISSETKVNEDLLKRKMNTNEDWWKRGSNER